MKHSCGAVLYTIDPTTNKLGIILGMEGWHWLPFKGCANVGESFEKAAIREINEETCGLVNIKSLSLDHHFNSKNKHYHMGLVKVDYNIINEFDKVREKTTKKEFLEKKQIKFFALDEIKRDITKIHNITRASIDFYWDKLLAISEGKNLQKNIRMRNNSYMQKQCSLDLDNINSLSLICYKFRNKKLY